MNLKKILLCAILVCFSAGCATQSEHLKRYLSNIPIESKLEKRPEIGEIYSVEIGESLIYEHHTIKKQAIDVSTPYSFNASNMGNKFSIHIEPGRYIATARDQSGVFYATSSGKISINNEAAGAGDANRGIYVPDNNSEATEFYIISNTGRPLNYDAPGIAYKKAIEVKIDPTLFKKELVYTGVSKNTITVIYREFSEGLARPAFTQELKYDLSEGKIVGFRGARFEVINATNTGITFRALNHLN